MLKKPSQYKSVAGFDEKLYGSSQPGYGTRNRTIKDERILQECKAGNQINVDEELLSNLKSLHEDGITTIYSLACYPGERLPELLKYLWETTYPGSSYITKLDNVDIGISDFSAPTLEQLQAITSNAIARMNNGEKGLVHCGAGKGRTGTILAAIKIAVSKDYEVKNNIDHIRNIYNDHAVEGANQTVSLKRFADKLQKDEIN